jgi:hypothetical protein
MTEMTVLLMEFETRVRSSELECQELETGTENSRKRSMA